MTAPIACASLPTNAPPSPTDLLVRLAVSRVASAPEDEQRYLELNFALDRAVERELRYRELLAMLTEGANRASPEDVWAWRLAAGLAANLMGDSLGAVRWLHLAREAVEGSGPRQSAADAYLQGELARAHYHLGQFQAGVEAVGAALQLARSARSLLSEAFAHHYLGLISTAQRDFPYARRHLNAALGMFERMQQRHGRARVQDGLASLEMDVGHYDVALELLEESLAVKKALRDLRGQAISWGNLARLHAAQGNYEAALLALERQQELAGRVGDERAATNVRIRRGELHLRHEHAALALTELREARSLAVARGDRRLEAHACFDLAEAAHRLGDLPAAREAIATACRYFPTSDEPLLRARADLRSALLDAAPFAAPELQKPLDRLRALEDPSALAEALLEIATALHDRHDPHPVTTLYAEAIDVAEPTHAAQIAEVIRARADSEEARAWVDTMLVIKAQKDRLEAALTELRRSEQLRDSLMQMIVHDLKNPITAITPWLYTLQSGLLEPPEADECLQQAIDECDTLLRMIDDLNDVGKMQLGGATELTLEALCLAELLEDVARRLQARAQEVGLRLLVEDHPPLPQVRADKAKLRRVLENLVTNAIKYGRPPDGPDGMKRAAVVRLSVALEPPIAEGDLPALRVEIRDSGAGIPAAESERVFEAYYQAEAGRKRKAGVGLGLSFSRMVIEAHGGAIWTQPNPTGGTIFAFRLPLPAGEP